MKKLIVEIDDKYADVVTMSFIGTTDTIPTTVATVILKQDVTAVAVCEDKSSFTLEGNFASGEEIPLKKLIDAAQQLEDLRCDREDFADYDEEDNAFVRDIAAIDTALAAIDRLIGINAKDTRLSARPSAKWVCMDNVYRLHAGECNLSAAKCSNCNSVICDIFHVSESLKYCPVCGAKMGKER